MSMMNKMMITCVVERTNERRESDRLLYNRLCA